MSPKLPDLTFIQMNLSTIETGDRHRLLLFNSSIHPYVQNHQDTVNPKP